MQRIAVIGVGKIGLCLALNLDRAGFPLLGVDHDAERITLLERRAIGGSEPGVEEALRTAAAIRFASNLSALPEFNPQIVFIAVDTPVSEKGGYDHSRVDCVLDTLFALQWPHDRVELAMMCTVLPGYCDSRSAAAQSHGFALSYTPGFVAQGSIMRDQQFPEQILIGEADRFAGDVLTLVFRVMCSNDPPLRRMSTMSAEIAKLALNCALTMKIAFANAIGDLATSVGAERDAILDVIGGDSRIGIKFLQYGYGFGGPCFPRDNRALTFFARQQNYEILQATATDEMNRRHLAFQLKTLLEEHGEREPIHFSYVAYKPGTEILDESQPLALAVQLAQAGLRVVIHESPAVVAQLRARFGDLFEYCDATSVERIL